MTRGSIGIGLVLACLAAHAVADEPLVWENPTRFTGSIDVTDRANWQVVPPKGIENGQVIHGDAVVEAGDLVAVFATRLRELTVFTRASTNFRQQFRVAPFPFTVRGSTPGIAVSYTDSTHENLVMKVSYGPAGDLPSVRFLFHDGLIEVVPDRNIDGVDVKADLAYTVVPAFIGDDLIYDPTRVGDLETLHVPSENSLLGLVEGGNAILVACWPEGNQRVRLAANPATSRLENARIEQDGKSLFLGLIHEPGIWFDRQMGRTDYEKTVTLEWNRPFPAEWIAQFCYQNYAAGDWRANEPGLLAYDGVTSTFRFWGGKWQTWRATAGFYEWPCWFRRDQAFLRIGSKILPPSQNVLIYALERNDATPDGKALPVDVMCAALGNDEAERLLDFEGRKKFYLYRGADGVFNEPTCGTTDALEEYFKRGQEVEKQELVARVADDIMHYYKRMLERYGRFEAFAAHGRAFIEDTRQHDPGLVSFLDEIGLEDVIEQIEDTASMKTMVELLPSAEKILDELEELCRHKRPDNYQVYMGLKRQITHRGGLLDSCASRGDLLLRGLAQKAGYRCIDDPEKARVAQELRAIIHEYLRNPTQWEQVR